MEFGFRFSSENMSAIIPPVKLKIECSNARMATMVFFRYRPFSAGARKLHEPKMAKGITKQTYLWPKADN